MASHRHKKSRGRHNRHTNDFIRYIKGEGTERIIHNIEETVRKSPTPASVLNEQRKRDAIEFKKREK